jgi:hypothetical protein
VGVDLGQRWGCFLDLPAAEIDFIIDDVVVASVAFGVAHTKTARSGSLSSSKTTPLDIDVVSSDETVVKNV